MTSDEIAVARELAAFLGPSDVAGKTIEALCDEVERLQKLAVANYIKGRNDERDGT